MPKTDLVYGNNYRPCPCAQITERQTTSNTYFCAVCYSPNRIKSAKITDKSQVRICMGGTSQGKRYTSCPYYEKNAKISVPKRKKKSSLSNIAFHVAGFIIFGLMGMSFLGSGAAYSYFFGLLFIAIGVLCLVSLFQKSSIVKSRKRK